MDSISEQVILFRIGERITLTLIVVLIALIVMVGFWRTVQRVHVDDGGKLGVAGSFALSTPVFVLMTIVGYAWVSLAHPIAIGPRAAVVSGQAPGAEVAARSNLQGGFIGATAADAPTSVDPGHARHKVTEQIRSLNCLAANQDLTDDSLEHLGQVKFALMAPVWVADWGDPTAFDAWVRGETLSDPNAAARAVYDAERSGC